MPMLDFSMHKVIDQIISDNMECQLFCLLQQVINYQYLRHFHLTVLFKRIYQQHCIFNIQFFSDMEEELT